MPPCPDGARDRRAAALSVLPSAALGKREQERRSAVETEICAPKGARRLFYCQALFCKFIKKIFLRKTGGRGTERACALPMRRRTVVSPIAVATLRRPPRFAAAGGAYHTNADVRRRSAEQRKGRISRGKEHKKRASKRIEIRHGIGGAHKSAKAPIRA